MVYAEYMREHLRQCRNEGRCVRCFNKFDYHGSFDSDGDRICWKCFKMEDLKNAREWDE